MNVHPKRFLLACACFALAFAPARSAQVVPGVYGYGTDRASNTAGFGANSTIVVVDKLDDYDEDNEDPITGTLRHAVGPSGTTPRVVVFAVSGVIKLKMPLKVRRTNLTIAGQTAPSPGIALHGAPLIVTKSNVLIQHLRVRAGDEWVPYASTHNRDAVNVDSGGSTVISNIVFDHCTFGWSIDEMANVWNNYDNVTFNKCIFAEPLNRSIHVDEGYFPNHLPRQAENLNPVTISGTMNRSTASSSLAMGGQYQKITSNSSGGTVEYTLTFDAAGNTRPDAHVVIAGVTGPDRAKFNVEVRDASGNVIPSLTTSTPFDQYSTTPQLVSYVVNVGSTGYTIPSGATTLKVRLIVAGKNPSSSGYTLSADLLSISEGHAMGPLIGAGGANGGGKLSIIGSVIAHLKERGPWVASKKFYFANNVLYNRQNQFVMLGSTSPTGTFYPMQGALIGNTFIEGRSMGSAPPSPINHKNVTTDYEIYETDNDFNTGVRNNHTPPALVSSVIESRRVSSDPTPKTDGLQGFTPLAQIEAYHSVLLSAGARPNDRDAMELRIINDIATGATITNVDSRTGAVKNSVAEAGGWPELGENAASWDPAIPSAQTANLDDDSDGYTNIEEWLHLYSARLEGSPAPDGAYQAEAATLANGTTVELIHPGYHGSGFVNFPTGTPTNGTLTFSNVDGGSGGTKILRIRYALSSGSRTGQIVINGSAQNITFNATGAWTTWATMDVAVTLTSGATNTIILKSTGQDLANIDEITVVANAVFDNFDDGNSNGWNAWGGTWSVVTDGTPVFRQNDNMAAAPYATLGANWDDQSVTTDIKVLSTGQSNWWVGVVARYLNSANYYYAKITGTTAEIKKLVNGTPTTLDSGSVSVSTNTWYTIKLQVIGDQLKLFVDGVEKASATDSSFSVGKAGLLMYRAAVEFDNVSADPTPAGSALLADDFADGNANGWTASSGTWSVVSQAYRQGNTGATVMSRSSRGSNWSDQIVEADAKPLTLPTGKWFGIAARYQNTTNYYYLKLGAGNVLELKKLVADVPTTLASKTYTITTNTTYALKLEVIGTSLRAYINGQLELRANDSALSSGSAGAALMTYGATADFDDVLVTAP